MNKMIMQDLQLSGKYVFCRVDFNVPLKKGIIQDSTRIRAALPTIQYLIEQGARVILASHLGRPKGQVQDELRLDPIAVKLAELLGQEVAKSDDILGEEVQQYVSKMQDGDVLLLENIRFHPGEEANDPQFAGELAALADLYVNDAFGAAHRAHASTEGMAKHLPAVAGFLLNKELEVLGKALDDPKRPFTAIIGGAKVKDKIGVIDNLLDKVDYLLIGGGLSYTFIKAQGHNIGQSLLEEDKIELARSFIEKAKKKGVKLVLPVDCVIADDFSNEANTRIVAVDQIPEDWQGLDCGPQTIDLFKDIIAQSATVLWNGPMGVFEMPKFANGTNSVGQAVADCPGMTIIGGGDSAAAVEKAGLAEQMSHISTGGGASLEFMEGKVLPGVAALTEKA